ncbi:hypothetical protein HWV23_03200 [Natronomonas halophila]|uniref:hypothetical protein n=1 Tax=Natronomonas halophila TaxID=2747817 RepID=UPI0015B6A328|nr:hypothetical protein [Natronomonas halophila]QLD84761.1 hypothetical protein HWV23_03200 [Natronomonas halophila]
MKNSTLPSGPVRPIDDPSVAFLLALPLAVIALFVAISYPLQAVVVTVSAIVGLKLLQRSLAARVRRTADRVREISIPGVGTVRFRVQPR